MRPGLSYRSPIDQSGSDPPDHPNDAKAVLAGCPSQAGAAHPAVSMSPIGDRGLGQVQAQQEILELDLHALGVERRGRVRIVDVEVTRQRNLLPVLQ